MRTAASSILVISALGTLTTAQGHSFTPTADVPSSTFNHASESGPPTGTSTDAATTSRETFTTGLDATSSATTTDPPISPTAATSTSNTSPSPSSIEEGYGTSRSAADSSPTPTSTHSALPTPVKDHYHSALSTDAKIGIGVGVGVGIALIACGLALFFLLRRRRADHLDNHDAAPVSELRNQPAMASREPALAAASAPGFSQSIHSLPLSASQYSLPRLQTSSQPPIAPVPLPPPYSTVARGPESISSPRDLISPAENGSNAFIPPLPTFHDAHPAVIDQRQRSPSPVSPVSPVSRTSSPRNSISRRSLDA